MKRHTYIEEMGLITSEKRVSRPVALAVLGLLAVGVGWAIMRAVPFQSPKPSNATAPAAVATSSVATTVPKARAVTQPSHANGGSNS